MNTEESGRDAVRRLVEQARTSKGMTKDELADAAGVSTKTLYNFQSGDRWPLPRVLRGIERALGITAFALADVEAHDTPGAVTLAQVTDPGPDPDDEAGPDLAKLTDRELIWELADRLQAKTTQVERMSNLLDSLGHGDRAQ